MFGEHVLGTYQVVSCICIFWCNHKASIAVSSNNACFNQCKILCSDCGVKKTSMFPHFQAHISWKLMSIFLKEVLLRLDFSQDVWHVNYLCKKNEHFRHCTARSMLRFPFVMAQSRLRSSSDGIVEMNVLYNTNTVWKEYVSCRTLACQERKMV